MSSENQSIINTDKIVSDNNFSDGVDVQSKSPIKPIDNNIQNNKLGSEFVNKNNTSEFFNNISVKNNILIDFPIIGAFEIEILDDILSRNDILNEF